LIERARMLSQQHRVTYDSEPRIEAIVKDIADIKQQFTQYAGARPFGVSLMIAGFDSEPCLYVTDVSGGYLQFKASAIGERDEKINSMLIEGYKDAMSCEQGIKLALDIFKKILEKDFNPERFDIAIIKKDKKIKMLSLEEKKVIV